MVLHQSSKNCSYIPLLLYSLGVIPAASRKTRLKLLWLSKPASSHISVSGFLVERICCVAYSSLIRFRYSRKFICSRLEKVWDK